MVLLVSCNSSSDETYKVREICINNHVYYKYNPTGSIAIRLTDDGKPIKCIEDANTTH